jgi:preprotein translocase subunit SecD
MLTAILGTHGVYDFLIGRIQKSGDLKKWFGIKEEGK